MSEFSAALPNELILGATGMIHNSASLYEPRYLDYIIPFSKTPEPILFHLFNIVNQLCYSHFPSQTPPDATVLLSNDEVPAGFEAHPVSGGITNRLFVVRWTEKYPTQPLLIRIFLSHSADVINRTTEARISLASSNECVSSAICGFFVNGRIEGFIETDDPKPDDKVRGAAPLTPDLMLEQAYSEAIADQLGKLHGSSLTWQEASNSSISELESQQIEDEEGDSTDQTPNLEKLPKPALWPTMQKWSNLALKRYAAFQDTPSRSELYHSLELQRVAREVVELKSLLNLLDDTVVFCHNDLLSGNILRLPKGFTWSEYRSRYGLAFHSHTNNDLLDHLPPTSTAPANSNNNILSPSSNQLRHSLSLQRSFSVANSVESFEEVVDAILPRENVADAELPSAVLFIDFEYASLNYACYDIGNHWNECAGFACDWSKFPNREFQERFLRTYLKANNQLQNDSDYLASPLFTARVDILRRRTLGFVLCSHLYWALWAVIMAANKPDIDFDYLAYSQLRLDGYWYMKNSCLLAIMPLVWSKLNQARWISQMSRVLNRALGQSVTNQLNRQEDQSTALPTTTTPPDNYNLPSVMIIGAGMSFNLALGTISASHAMYVNHLVLRQRSGESEDEWRSRVRPCQDQILAYNQYYGFELGLHLDYHHLHLCSDLLKKYPCPQAQTITTTPTNDTIDTIDSAGVTPPKPALCGCATPGYHIAASAHHIYSKTGDNNDSTIDPNIMLQVYQDEINAYITTVTQFGLNSNGQLLLPAEAFFSQSTYGNNTNTTVSEPNPSSGQFFLTTTTTSDQLNSNNRLQQQQQEQQQLPKKIVNPVTNLTAIYKSTLASFLGLPPPQIPTSQSNNDDLYNQNDLPTITTSAKNSPSCEINPLTLTSNPSAYLIYAPYEPFSYQQASHTRNLELAIVGTGEYQKLLANTFDFLIQTTPAAATTETPPPQVEIDLANDDLTEIKSKKEFPSFVAQFTFPQGRPMVWKSQEECYQSLPPPALPSTIFIATPPLLHHSQAITALNNNRHVVVDKPFTPSEKQSVELFSLAKKNSLLISSFQNRRFDSDFITSKWISQHYLGKNVNWFESAFQKGISSKPWKMTKNSEAGGRLFDLGAHAMDQLLVMLQEQRNNGTTTTSSSNNVLHNNPPVRVYANIRYDIDGFPQTDSHGLIELTFANGHVGYIDVNSFTMIEKPKFMIVGDIATLSAPVTSVQSLSTLLDYNQSINRPIFKSNDLCDQQEAHLLSFRPVECAVERGYAEIRYRPLANQPRYYQDKLFREQLTKLRLVSQQDINNESQNSNSNVCEEEEGGEIDIGSPNDGVITPLLDNSTSNCDDIDTISTQQMQEIQQREVMAQLAHIHPTSQLIPFFNGRWARFFEHFYGYMCHQQLYIQAKQQSKVPMLNPIVTTALLDDSNNSNNNNNTTTTTTNGVQNVHRFDSDGVIFTSISPGIVLNAHYSRLTQSANLDDITAPQIYSTTQPQQLQQPQGGLCLKKLSMPVRPMDTIIMAKIFDAILLSAKTKMPVDIEYS